MIIITKILYDLYELLKICLKILFLKLLRPLASLISFGNKLKLFAARKAKAFCPVASLHLGSARSFFCLVSLW